MSGKGRVVIFFDVDGVVVPVSPMSFGGGDIDPACVKRLSSIVEACGGAQNVTIVLSSTWRHDEAKQSRLNEAFAAAGGIPTCSLGVPDGTPSPTTVTYLKKDPQEQKLVRDRVDELYYWMKLNEATFPEAYVGGRWFAIDDMNLGVDDRMKGHFVKTDTEEGIQMADVATARSVIANLPEYSGAPVTQGGVPQQDDKAKESDAAATKEPQNAPVPATAPEQQPNVAQRNDGAGSETLVDVQALAANMKPLVEGPEYYGVVKRYNPNRGFGFITASINGEDVFVHQSMIRHAGFRAVNVGEAVKFRLAIDPQTHRRQAVDVTQMTPYVHSQVHRMMSTVVGGMPMEMLGMPPDMLFFPPPPPPPPMFVGAAGPRGGFRGAAADAAALPPPTTDPSEVNAVANGDGSAVASGSGSVGQRHTPQKSQYLGPGVPGRGIHLEQLPLLPDGMGFRAANGCVFYPLLPAVMEEAQPLPIPQQVPHRSTAAVTTPAAAVAAGSADQGHGTAAVKKTSHRKKATKQNAPAAAAATKV